MTSLLPRSRQLNLVRPNSNRTDHQANFMITYARACGLVKRGPRCNRGEGACRAKGAKASDCCKGKDCRKGKDCCEEILDLAAKACRTPGTKGDCRPQGRQRRLPQGQGPLQEQG